MTPLYGYIWSLDGVPERPYFRKTSVWWILYREAFRGLVCTVLELSFHSFRYSKSEAFYRGVHIYKHFN